MAIAIFSLGFLPSLADGLRAPSLRAHIYYPLDEAVEPGGLLQNKNTGMLTAHVTTLEDKQVIDFEKRQIVFQKVDKLGFVVWEYRYNELDDYLENRRAYALSQSWFDFAGHRKSAEAAQRDRQFSLDFALPVHYPTWAQRILGKEPPKLSIHGYEEIITGWDYSAQEWSGIQGQRPSSSPVFENKYNLTVNGSVGRLINVNMSSTSEEEFSLQNPLKDIKIEYKGEGNELEDEVIQEVTAGYTNFAIPGTKLSGYSESKEGLFGLSMKSKIGPLNLTTVISHEQGEALEKTFSTTSASGESGTPNIKEKDFEKYRYYFLDTVYLNAYNAKYNLKNPHAPDPPPPVVRDNIQVWRKLRQSELQSQYLSDVQNLYRYVRDSDSSGYSAYKKINSYYLNREEGWIRFDDTLTLQDIDVIGVYFQALRPDRSIALWKGDTGFVDTVASNGDSIKFKKDNLDVMKSLWILKEDENFAPADSSGFKLMWRNTYKLPKFTTADFKIEVIRFDAGAAERESTDINDANVRYSSILGLTDANGIRKPDSRMYDVENGSLILPPFTDSAKGNEPFRNPELGAKNIADYVYRFRTVEDSFSRQPGNYYLKMSGQYTKKETTFSLGWGIIPNSVKVWGDGQELRENYDYRVDYDGGQLQLLSLNAQNKSSIRVQYQSESIFVPEKTVFMGARGELKLPFLGKNAFIGSSVLYQMKSTRDEIPRFGQVPFNKLLLDVNSSMEFEPEWMTAAVNALPFIATDAKSSIKLDFELAHSRMYPTTGSKALVDDFESSDSRYQLGLDPTTWQQASPPMPSDSLLLRPPAWRSYWFSPLNTDKNNTVYRDSVFDIQRTPNTTTQNQDDFESVLKLVAQPRTGLSAGNFASPWAGIMTGFPSSIANRTKDQYFQFVINAGDRAGKLYVDLGMISEDLCQNYGPPNGRLDEELKIGEIFSDTSDKGLDHEIDNSKEFRLIPDTTHSNWDTLFAGNPKLPLPNDPSGDNFKSYVFYSDHRADSLFPYSNGTQGDRIADHPPSSEDINNDGFSRANSYFRYVLDLRTIDSSKYIDKQAKTKQKNGWYLVRIPIGSRASGEDSVGLPSWERISHVRLWWSDFGTSDSSKHTLTFARIQFVANQWEQVTRPETTVVAGQPNPLITTIEPAVINTEDDSTYDTLTSANISYVRDQYGKIQKEQSLRLKFNGILPGKSVFVRRYFSDYSIDLSAYNTLSLFVHGDRDYSADSLYFVFRIGTNDSTFYEYRTLVRPGWNVPEDTSPGWEGSENITFDFRELADAKMKFLDDNGDTATVDTSWSVRGSGPPYISIKSRTRTPPTISSIKTFMFGVVRGDSGNTSAVPDSGEIWIDDMKVSGLKGVNGSAASASISTQWADFMSLNARADYRDGNFREMTQSDIAPGRSLVSGGADVHFTLDKFLPQDWRVSLPLNASVTASTDRPQLRPGTDIPLSGADRVPDNFFDLVTHAETPASHFETKTLQQSLSTSFRKSPGSKNFLVGLTAERLSLDNVSYQFRQTHERQGWNELADSDFVHLTTSKDYGASVKYDLTPREPPKWTKWRPFSAITQSWFPSQAKGYELTFLPTNLSFDLAGVRYTDQYEQNDRLGLKRPQRTFDLSHGLQFKYVPISSLLDFDYTMDIARALSADLDSSTSWQDFAINRVLALDPDWDKYFFLRGETTRNQRAGFNLDPKFVDWLSHRLTYSSTFRSTRDKLALRGFSVSGDLAFTGSVSLKTFLTSVASTVDSVKALNKAIDVVQQAFDRFEFSDINVTYNANYSLVNNTMDPDFLDGHGIHAWELFCYELGIPVQSRASAGTRLRNFFTGDLDSTAFGGMQYRRLMDDSLANFRNDSRDVTRKWGMSTNFKLPDPVDVRISNISLDHEKHYRLTPDTVARDTTTVFPKVAVNATSGILSKIPIINNNIKGTSLSSSYQYSRETLSKWTYVDTAAVHSEMIKISHTMQPLVQFSGTLNKWPVNINYQHGWTVSNENNKEYNKKTTSQSHSDDGEVRYSVEKTSQKKDIKILMWSVPLRGRADISLHVRRTRESGEMTSEQSESAEGGAKPPLPTKDLTDWLAETKLNYDFTDKVTGGASYSFTQKAEVVPEKKTSVNHSFRLNVRISF